MNIFLIGLMGSGKTYWSKQLSVKLNIPAFDLDSAIENIEGKSVAEIFSEKGEEYFRQKENNILKSFAHKQDFILSTGGGAPCFYDNMKWMNTNGITIWIDEPVEIIAMRLEKKKAHRPLIANIKNENLVAFLAEMRNKRKPFYEQAKFHLTGNVAEENFLKIFLSNE